MNFFASAASKKRAKREQNVSEHHTGEAVRPRKQMWGQEEDGEAARPRKYTCDGDRDDEAARPRTGR